MSNTPFEIEIVSHTNWMPGYYAGLYAKLLREWYQHNDFLVLNYLNSELPNSVHFPYIPELLNDKDFTALAQDANTYDPFNITDVFRDKDFKQFTSSKFIYPLEFAEKLRKQISLIDDEFYRYLSELFEIKDEKLKLFIFPTDMGTIGSTYFIKGDPTELYITVRKDRNILEVVKCIFYYFLNMRKKSQNIILEWRQTEAIVDFLISTPFMVDHFKPLEYSSLLKSILNKNYNSEILLESERYLQRLGVGQKNYYVVKENGEIFINSKRLEVSTASNIYKLFLLLIDNKGSICSSQLISDTLYGAKSADKYSMQYIAKLVDESRDVLESSHLPRELIKTKYRKGYFIE